MSLLIVAKSQLRYCTSQVSFGETGRRASRSMQLYPRLTDIDRQSGHNRKVPIPNSCSAVKCHDHSITSSALASSVEAALYFGEYR
jgi:hypothetical protein